MFSPLRAPRLAAGGTVTTSLLCLKCGKRKTMGNAGRVIRDIPAGKANLVRVHHSLAVYRPTRHPGRRDSASSALATMR